MSGDFCGECLGTYTENLNERERVAAIDTAEAFLRMGWRAA